MNTKILAVRTAIAFALSSGLAIAGPTPNSAGLASSMSRPSQGGYGQSNVDEHDTSYGEDHDHGRHPYTLPVKQIEHILQVSGTVSHGVLTIEPVRTDLHVTGPGGIPFTPPFELANELHFQPLDNGRALLNGDAALRPSEVQPFIDQLLHTGLVMQAFHQHFYDVQPMVYFIHFRGIGDPIQLANAARDALSVTGTPFPQQAKPDPTTPLNPRVLAHILGGSAQVEDHGIVVVTIPRRHDFKLGGVHAETETGLQTNVQFEPLGNGKVAVAPDFAMTASETQPLLQLMRRQGFKVECLYNQETDEHPQLYFSHQLKVGDPYKLAREVRRGLDKTDSARAGDRN